MSSLPPDFEMSIVPTRDIMFVRFSIGATVQHLHTIIVDQ